MRSAGSQTGAGVDPARGSGRGSKARSKRGSSGRSGRSRRGSGLASWRGSGRGSGRDSVRGSARAAGGAAAVSPASALGRRVCRGRRGRSLSLSAEDAEADAAGAGGGGAALLSSLLAARLRGARFTGASRYGLSSPVASGAGRVRGRRVGFGSVIRLLRVGQTAYGRSDACSASDNAAQHGGAARPGLWPWDAGTGTAQGGADAQDALVRVLGGTEKARPSHCRLRVCAWPVPLGGTHGGQSSGRSRGPRRALPGRAPQGAPRRYIHLRGAVSIAPPGASRNPRLLPRPYRKGFCGRESPFSSRPDCLALWA